MSNIRYMGTKRFLIPEIHRYLSNRTVPADRFVDLFAGTAAVASSLADVMPVTCNDALSFPPLVARARVLQGGGRIAANLAHELLADARSGAVADAARVESRISREREALDDGPAAVHNLIADSKHPANSDGAQKSARRLAGSGNYELVRLYFSRGYFSTEQAIMLDRLRQSIDESYPESPNADRSWDRGSLRDVLIAAWLTTASMTINSPGHTAQFLSSRTEAGYRRVRQNWNRDVLQTYEGVLQQWGRTGGTLWRRRNRVMQSDATEVPRELMRRWNPRTVLYADPPYTKDHYSRYYHVLETLALYDYPTIAGIGRVRTDRHLSDFCYRTRAANGFAGLASLATACGADLLISYPDNGLLSIDELRAGVEDYGRLVLVAQSQRTHSTLGASKGRRGVPAVENLFLLASS